MARPPDSDETRMMRIGEVLKRARTRQGMEIREVEERTKIRTKYLRALEAEDWDVLPSPAYARGFLRTYAQLLGLDADAISDEFRRQVEGGREPDHSYRLSEPLLETRRRLGGPDGGPGVGVFLALGAAAALGVLLLVGLIGGDDDDGERAERQRPAVAREKAEKRKESRTDRKRERAEAKAEESERVVLKLEVNADLQVCLLSGSGEVLIDSQVLNAGTQEQFERDRFQLRFPSGYDRGQFDLTLNGDSVRLPEVTGPTAYEIEPGAKPRPLKPPGLECP